VTKRGASASERGAPHDVPVRSDACDAVGADGKRAHARWPGEVLTPGRRQPRVLPITVVMPTLNEAARIRDAIAALAWADDVIVVDGGSADGTPELARIAGARVIPFVGGTIAGQRNAGIAAARNPWVLALDADERVPHGLRSELAAVLAAPRHAAYRVRLRNFYLGRELRHGRWGHDWHVRLFQRERRFIEQRVHERLEPVSDVGSLRAPLEHTPYRDLAHHLEKIVRYAQWGAQDLYARGRRASAWDITARPVWRFVREFVIYSGWRDGRRGLLAAAVDACAPLLKYAHLFALEWRAAPPQAIPVSQPPQAPPMVARPESELTA